jgi:hypothetical protein
MILPDALFKAEIFVFRFDEVCHLFRNESFLTIDLICFGAEAKWEGRGNGMPLLSAGGLIHETPKAFL